MLAQRDVLPPPSTPPRLTSPAFEGPISQLSPPPPPPPPPRRSPPPPPSPAPPPSFEALFWLGFDHTFLGGSTGPLVGGTGLLLSVAVLACALRARRTKADGDSLEGARSRKAGTTPKRTARSGHTLLPSQEEEERGDEYEHDDADEEEEAVSAEEDQPEAHEIRMRGHLSVSLASTLD